ncbi:MAG: pentapeptide repeat-containing protein [Marmoricola sp.]
MSHPDLSSDCSRCFGLCCVLLPFGRSAGFGADKPGGVACHHLDQHDRCGIHDRLREDGWPGCTVFECFGAGQQVSQVTYRGDSWRARDQNQRAEMAAVLSVMRLLHEMLAHLREAQRRTPDPGAGRLYADIVRLTALDPVSLLGIDLDELHERVGALLGEAGLRLRRPARGRRLARDLAGRDLRRHDLRDADLRGTALIAADLRGLDLGRADLLGADLRDADVCATDLSRVLFLTQPQVNAARGDTRTRLPEGRQAPKHWGKGTSGA